jgi:hypothetical protein
MIARRTHRARRGLAVLSRAILIAATWLTTIEVASNRMNAPPPHM